MAEDWVVGSPWLFRGKVDYVRGTRDLVTYLLRVQCHMLEPHDGVEESYGPVPNTRLRRITNSTLAADVWSYHDCSARYVRDCSLLHRTKYLIKNVFRPTVGSCP